MDQLLIALFLAIVLALFLPFLQTGLRRWFVLRPRRIFLAPAVLSALFLFFMWRHGALNLPFAALIAAYTFAPASAVYFNGPGGGPHRRAKQQPWLDLAAIMMLWLPQELLVGQELVPKPLQGTAHTVGYGVAVTLALLLFLIFRGTPGMKYCPPSHRKDFVLPLAGLALSAPLLAFLGLQLSFINPFHVPAGLSFATVAKAFLITAAGVALPEEILFRSLIQNWIMQRFGFHWRSLLVAGAIFGAAHLNNAPGGFPNWRYMILATIAGVIYGKVFQESNTILSSAALHAAVNTIKRFFF